MKLPRAINIINFPAYRTPSGEIYFEMKIDLTANENQGNFVHFADNIGIKAANIEELEQSWDDREFFFSFGKLKLVLADTEQTIREALLSTDIKIENSEILFFIKRKGQTTYSEEFKGNLDWDYSFDKNNNATLSFSPATEKLARAATNINGQWNDLFGGKYSFGPWNNSNIYNLREVITDFFKLINPNIQVEIINDWQYKTAIYNQQQYEGYFDQLGVSIQNMFGGWIQSNKFTWAFENYLQVLKSALLSLGFFGGTLSSSKAVVYNVFDYNPERIINTDNLLIDKKPTINKEQLKFLRLISNQYVWQTAGTDTGISDQKLDIIVRGSIFKVWVSSLNEFITLSYIRKPPNQYEYWASFLIQYFANYYLGPNSKRRDEIIISGTDYNISNLFLIDGFYHIPISLIKDFNKNTTRLITVPFLPDSGNIPTFEGQINQYQEMPPNFATLNENQVIGEIIMPDGNTDEFETNYKFIINTLRVYLNGVRLREGIDEDYQIISDNRIKFSFIPELTDKITADYLIKTI
ncbi:MAG: hypothetical protein AMXMBFR51_21150 [Ignavibacteriota bacterium]